MTTNYLKTHEAGTIGVITLNRANKRNALDEAAVAEIDAYFSNIPAHIRAIVMLAEGDHFCAGLDLKEHHDQERSAVDFLRVCQAWHRAFDKIQHGGIPVIACLQGAVVGGGLELASAAHVRVADVSTYFSLPEGTRGIFTGGGATVRTAKIITPNRMVEMMLTGRVMGIEEGHRLGLAHYVCNTPENPVSAKDFAMELAERIAGNAPLSNYAIVSSISRIADMSATDGLFAEGLMAAVVQTGADVQGRLNDFVTKKAHKVKPG
ncbi:crotonase/enoyl-CoA hydratase family protein [Pusillimonas sp. ANT_WB101]|uniref:crotonase/enoyl-CoA hydratase family protein n=1 Tax=Pusillimonas sp. ANT_WB101 TaxID=2597356 RepID=UPI0011ECF325|nr:crotonase/enoyl-CoA hydratase family protein [Pusillimonas sp. ANT_WB101]KAA0910843.1 crotonase/enoyl-CoA hydratase family protein [Pusillimonas sp. ANT_WB101]NYT78953.1 crotonase/enoyl-CoA hydratase family protein [Alcaligenaceae bacterium]